MLRFKSSARRFFPRGKQKHSFLVDNNANFAKYSNPMLGGRGGVEKFGWRGEGQNGSFVEVTFLRLCILKERHQKVLSY